MANARDNDWDEEYSVIGDEGGVSFEDFQDDKSLFGFNPLCQGPVFISVPFPLSHGKPQSSLVGETAADPITIRNTTEDPVELWCVRIFSSNPKDCYMLSLMRPPQDNSDEEAKETFVGSTVLDDRVLQPGETLTVWLSCKPEEIGMHTAVIHFVVGDEKIERVAFLLVDDNISQALASSKPFTRTQRRKKFDFDQYIPASRPPRSAKQEFRYILPQFPIPRDVREVIESRQVPGVITDGLNDQNYSTFFSTLLFMEEIHLEEEMRGHDMELVSMRRKGNYLLALEVPGLAEKRPSLVYGDFIFVKPASDGLPDHIRPYQGYIYRVEANEVCLKFADEFHHLHQDGNLYNVSFAYNRVNMRRLYQAIQAAEGLGTELLFPSVLSKRRMIRTRKPVVPLNKNLNLEQLNCVKKILECRGAPPYVIHGPPGTGKTMTLVEAISQICRLEACARVLVCASSNSAADHVLEKLVGEEGAGVGDSKIFRLNATSRPYDDLKAEYIQFCFFQDMVFKCPPLKALLRYRIIVSTYMSASLLYAEGIRRGHFTHILLDEAGQASEPETMVPIANLCNRETVIVLAGDHLQLGPVIFSKEAESHGLGQSYLQRLFKYDIYKNEDENYVTKLVRNYRCHPAILELPSKLFYNGELIASKDENDFPIYKLVDITKNQFPVLFVGIQGCDEREGSNPSWFNRIEVSKVIELIRKLKWNMEFSESDIGVITPYRQQVLKLKKALESLEMADVKVGSVEQFQGQEREIIFISTVRSTVKHNEFDRDHNLGFLSNPRRFNVAITRARSLLVIVGNPHIITKDPFWDRLLRHCAENGSYHGCPLPEPEMHYYPDDTATTYVEANPNKIIWNDLPAEYTNEVAWDEELPNECRDEVEWDQIPMQCQKEVESTALSRRCRNEGECNGTATTYVGANPDEIIWNDLPAEYTNEVSWDEELPNECRDEVEWDQIPTQFQEEVESTALARHSRNEGECNEPPLQHIKEADWKDHLMQYTDEGEWNEDLMIGHVDEADKNMPRQCADEVEWDEYIPEVCTDDVKRTKATPGQYTVEVGSSEYIPRQYSDEVEWNKGCIQHCKKDTERNKGNSKQYTRRTGKVDQHQQKRHFDQYEQNEDNQHCRDAGWSEGNDEEWNEQRSKQHSQRAEWKNSSAGGVMKSRNGTGSDKLSNKVQWDREKHKRYSNKTEWQQASSSGGGTKAITRETGRHGYDPNMFPNKFKLEEQRPKESSHRHAWSKIPSSTGGQKRGKNEVEMLGQSFQNAELN